MDRDSFFRNLGNSELLAVIEYEICRRSRICDRADKPIPHDLMMLNEIATRYQQLVNLDDNLNEERISSSAEKDAEFEVTAGQFMPLEAKPNFTSLDEFMDHMNSIADNIAQDSTEDTLNGLFASHAIRMAMNRLKEIR